MSAVATDGQQWACGSCHFVYDEVQGWPAEGIAPGIRWQDVPHDWR